MSKNEEPTTDQQHKFKDGARYRARIWNSPDVGGDPDKPYFEFVYKDRNGRTVIHYDNIHGESDLPDDLTVRELYNRFLKEIRKKRNS